MAFDLDDDELEATRKLPCNQKKYKFQKSKKKSKKKISKLVDIFIVAFLVIFFLLSFSANMIEMLHYIPRILINMGLGIIGYKLIMRLVKIILSEGEE